MYFKIIREIKWLGVKLRLMKFIFLTSRLNNTIITIYLKKEQNNTNIYFWNFHLGHSSFNTMSTMSTIVFKLVNTNFSHYQIYELTK